MKYLGFVLFLMGLALTDVECQELHHVTDLPLGTARITTSGGDVIEDSLRVTGGAAASFSAPAGQPLSITVQPDTVIRWCCDVPPSANRDTVIVEIVDAWGQGWYIPAWCSYNVYWIGGRVVTHSEICMDVDVSWTPAVVRVWYPGRTWAPWDAWALHQVIPPLGYEGE